MNIKHHIYCSVMYCLIKGMIVEISILYVLLHPSRTSMTIKYEKSLNTGIDDKTIMYKGVQLTYHVTPMLDLSSIDGQATRASMIHLLMKHTYQGVCLLY